MVPFEYSKWSWGQPGDCVHEQMVDTTMRIEQLIDLNKLLTALCSASGY